MQPCSQATSFWNASQETNCLDTTCDRILRPCHSSLSVVFLRFQNQLWHLKMALWQFWTAFNATKKQPWYFWGNIYSVVFFACFAVQPVQPFQKYKLGGPVPDIDMWIIASFLSFSFSDFESFWSWLVLLNLQTQGRLSASKRRAAITIFWTYLCLQSIGLP